MLSAKPRARPPAGRSRLSEQKRRLEIAASNPEWEHVYSAAVLAANTSMRELEVTPVRRKNVDLEKVCDMKAPPVRAYSTSGTPSAPSAAARTSSASTRASLVSA
jgi:hypothetical protein